MLVLVLAITTLLAHTVEFARAYGIKYEPNNARVLKYGLSLKPVRTSSFFPQKESFCSHNQRIYIRKKLSEMQTGDFITQTPTIWNETIVLNEAV